MNPLDRPVFVLGERAAAMPLIWALEATPNLCAMPANRLLRDLLLAVEHSYADLQSLTGLDREGFRPPASWYREVQAARARHSGKVRTVEFSGLAVRRLNHMFPDAQFLVVHALERAIPRSRRLPPLPAGRILEVGSNVATDPETLEQVLAFLDEPAAGHTVLDLAEPERQPHGATH